MDTAVKHISILSGAIFALMKPLARMLIRNGVTFQSFSDVAKRAFVDVGMNQFEIDGRKQTISRVAVLTGLSRKEVQRVLNEGMESDTETHERYNRASWVVAGWVRDLDFCNDDGRPASLPLEGNKGFAELVRRYSGDVPARAVLDELQRVGTVRVLDNGRIKLLTRAYVPRASNLDKVAILGTDVADLIETIDHNMERGEREPYFQRKVMYDNVPVEAVQEFQAQSSEQLQAMMEGMDKWLAQHDRDVTRNVKGTGRARVGVGIYYFEEKLPSRATEKLK